MEKLLDKLKECMAAKHPCVVYCKPGSDVVTGVFQQDNALYPADFSKEGFVFAPFSEGKTAFIPYHIADVFTAKSENIERNSAEVKKPEIDPIAKIDFERLVSKSIDAIASGQFEKLVCSRTEIVPLDKDIAAIFRSMVHLYPNAFRYCFYHPDTGIWMGATPEQLIRAEGKTIHTVALAGTQLYKYNVEAEWHDKEKHEQQIVTDYIVSELKDSVVCMETSEPYTFRAGNLVHIKTDIKAEINEHATLEKVIKKLHPTPAVCGLPTDEARSFLIGNEGYDRECYSGFLGEINMNFADNIAGKTDLFVNLRCMQIEDENARLFIGCGITAESDPEKEFIETVNKSMTMRRVL